MQSCSIKLRGVICHEPKHSPAKLFFQAINNVTVYVGFIHNSVTVGFVGTCVQVKRCVVSCTQSSDGVSEALILCKCRRNNDGACIDLQL